MKRFLVLVFYLAVVVSNFSSVLATIAYSNVLINASAGLVIDSSVETEILLDNKVQVAGDLTFKASTQDMVIRVGTLTAGSSSVDITPRITSDTNPNQYGHIIFEAAEGKKITVQLHRDTFFSGANVDTVTLVNEQPTELSLTFRGRGQIIFELADGVTLSHTSLSDDGLGNLNSTNAEGAAGVKVLVAMDQTRSEVIKQGRSITENGQGKNKLVYRRMLPTVGVNVMNGGDNDCIVRFGLNSLFTFVSINHTGLDDSTDPLPVQMNNPNSGNLESYAAVAFDVSNYQKGRLVLELDCPVVDAGGGNFVQQLNTFRDGSFVIQGNYLQDSGGNPSGVLDAGFYGNGTVLGGQNHNYRLHVNFTQAAGCQAFFRVIDEQAYTKDLNGYRAALNPTSGEVGILTGSALNTRRGLLIRCLNGSLRSFAANTYSDGSWFFEDIFTQAGGTGRGNYPIRHGFVLGINGVIEVNHNTFVEYEAQSPNTSFNPSALGMTTLNTSLTTAGVTNPDTIFKKHNPSALLVDGLGAVIVSGNDQILFQAHINPDILRRAEVLLLGNASMTVRAPLLADYSNPSNPIPTLGVYDGYRLAVAGETTGDGISVLDIEGFCGFRALPDNYVPLGGVAHITGSHIGSDYQLEDVKLNEKNPTTNLLRTYNRKHFGQLRLGSLRRSFDDKEITGQAGFAYTDITRPLTIGASYARYNRASILANNSIDFIDLDFYHEDVSRNISPDPALSDAVIMGGERATLYNEVYDVENPDILFWRLYNSNVHCRESMAISGVRLMVRELPGYLNRDTLLEDGDNASSIIMYNKGHLLDTNLRNFGRVFLMGSSKNEVAAGGTKPFLRNAYMSAFRHTGGENSDGSDAINKKVSLSLKTAHETNAATGEKAVQMFFMGNDSNVEVGWTTVEGISRDNDGIVVYPFDHKTLDEVNTGALGSQARKFKLDATFESPATFAFEGDLIFLGGRGPNGEGSPSLVNSFGLGRVIYMGHGGKISIGSQFFDGDAPARPYVGFSDATIAIRLAKLSQPGLNTQMSLPFDQMILKRPIRPYDINLNDLTDGLTDKHLRLSALTGAGLGTEVSIAWDQIVQRPPESSMSPFDGSFGVFTDFGPFNHRAVTQITAPVPMPTQGLLLMSSGDFLDQLAVSGSSLANPFLLYLTGDKSGIATVKEIASEDSISLVPGEGAFAKIYMDNGARLGLGSRDWNDKSVKAWNLIGLNRVTLHPNGDAQIDLNDDVVVTDNQPIIPTENFGKRQSISGEDYDPEHRITFFSHDTREVRVPTGKELDLGAFGSLTGTNGQFTQQIAFAGKTRLIFEPGSTLRFPADPAYQPVLYMNEEAELIFESIKDMENKFEGVPSAATRWTTIDQTDRSKIRIVGKGQIWLNKHSKMIINDGALVAVESDSRTPETDLTISLQRDAQMILGDDNNAGGSLQIGNPRYYFNTITDTIDPLVIAGAEVNFTLRLDSDNCLVNLGRNAFFGLGVGVVDRFENRVNSWKLQTLQHVRNVNLRLLSGIFSHNRIFDGNDSNSSLMAIGPISGGNYKLEFGPNADSAIFRGGGNLLFSSLVPTAPTSVITPSVASTVVALTADATNDAGKYNIVGSTKTLAQRRSLSSAGVGTQVGTLTSFSESAFSAGSFGLQANNPIDAFNFLSFQNILEQTPNKYVALSISGLEEKIGYVTGTTIVRSTSLPLEGEIFAADVRDVADGVMRIATENNLGDVSTITVPR